MNKNYKIIGIILLSISILFPINESVFSQDLKKVTNNPYPGFVEKYSVMKNDRNIKEGPYKLTIYGKVYQTGFYKNNQRSGIWKIYKDKNVLDFTYDYDNNLLSNLSKDYLSNPNDTTSHGPIYLGGMEYFMLCIGGNLNIPEEVSETNKLGYFRTIIKFNIDTLGLPNNFTVQSSCKNAILDQAALNAVTKVATSSFSFLPAKENGKPIKIPMLAPVSFSF